MSAHEQLIDVAKARGLLHERPLSMKYVESELASSTDDKGLGD